MSPLLPTSPDDATYTNRPLNPFSNIDNNHDAKAAVDKEGYNGIINNTNTSCVMRRGMDLFGGPVQAPAIGQRLSPFVALRSPASAVKQHGVGMTEEDGDMQTPSHHQLLFTPPGPSPTASTTASRNAEDMMVPFKQQQQPIGARLFSSPSASSSSLEPKLIDPTAPFAPLNKARLDDGMSE